GGVRFRDAEEGVPDAPAGAEQADEGRGRADGGEHAGAAQHAPAAARFDALEPRRDPLLDAVVVGQTGGELQLGRGRAEELRNLTLNLGKLLDLVEGAYAGELLRCRPHPPLGEKDLDRLVTPHRPGDE